MPDKMSDLEKRKARIRRRLTIARYSKPDSVAYTDENDHNPWVLEKCPHCHGTGKNCSFVEAEMTYYHDICSNCKGERFTGELIRKFSNESVPAEATTTVDGWVRCPGCGRAFKLSNSASWSGRRHITCGQKIIPLGNA